MNVGINATVEVAIVLLFHLHIFTRLELVTIDNVDSDESFNSQNTHQNFRVRFALEVIEIGEIGVTLKECIMSIEI